MKQNLENFENLKKGNTSHTKEVITQIDQTTDSLSSIMEATNAHMDKTTENINENVQNTEEQFKKELNTEITDLRAILSTIRSDIELMKSVLTKVDSKVH